MLHEVVVSLLGKPGPLLKSLDLDMDFKTFLHPHEIQLLHEILVVAKNFKQLQDFIETNRFNTKISDNKNDSSVEPGLYLQAFSESVDDVLNDYRQEVISLEQTILSDSNTTLLYIYSRLENHRRILSALCCFTQDIYVRNIHGCKILQLLHDANVTATDNIKCSISRILQGCHRVLLKQISNWLLNGCLVDPFNEFFIAKEIPEKSEILSICIDDSSDVNSQRQVRENNLRNETFILVAEYIPTYIPYSLANVMLFIGRIVVTLNKNPQFKYALAGELNQFVFKNKEVELYRNFDSLSKHESLDIADLQKIVWEIKSFVVEYLWKVAVEEHDLYDQLRFVKKFYLLGQADLFIDLLKNLNVFIKARSNKVFIQNFNTYLRESVYITQSIDETTLEKFNFYLTPSTTTSNDADKSGSYKNENIWSSIMLEYRTCWPLDLLFTKNVMLRYNKLFTLLLRIRNCHLNIHQIWIKEMKNKSVKKSMLSWKLRNELMFLINNLQFYLQVDVIETEYGSLIELIRRQKDFQQLIRIHHIFLLNMLYQSFISSTQNSDDEEEFNQSLSTIKPHKIYLILNEIFQICDKFCAIMMKDKMDEIQKTKEYQNMINNLSLLRSALISALLTLQFQPLRRNLSKLLLRLDMNSWFTRNSVHYILPPFSSEIDENCSSYSVLLRHVHRVSYIFT